MASGTNSNLKAQHGFNREFKINWYRSPVDRKTLTALMRRNDLRGWLQTIAHLGWFFVTGGIAFFVYELLNSSNWYWSVPLLMVCLFIHGTIGPFMGLIAIHELDHRTVFKSRKLNEFLEVIYAFISWSDHIWYRASHTIHHQETCHREYDGEVVLPLRFSLGKFRVLLNLLAWDPHTTYQRVKRVWRHANGHIDGAWYNYVLPGSDTNLRTRHRNWARILLVGHTAFALTFIATGNWFLIVVFTFGTFYCSWLGLLCGLPQHNGLNSDIPDFRANTRTFNCSWLPAFYYWNMQYHLEHHMYPAVPFYNLPKLRQVIEQDLPVAPHGLLNTWREMIDLKQRFLADPTFQYLPMVPRYANGDLKSADSR